MKSKVNIERDNKIKAIIFDFIGVLLVKKTNYKPDILIDKIDSLIGQVTDDNNFKLQIKKEYHLTNLDLEIILKKIVNKYVKFQPLWDLLPDLKKKYKLAIINNGTGLTVSQFRQKHKIDVFFDLFLSSAELGSKKPDKKIYLNACRLLQVKPSECLFLDDTYVNVKGARKVGMKAITWDGSVVCLNNIRKLVNL